jgi:antitoxin (DNA-binding transcriptional repressor) of toxin-antitoxin stability system
MKRYSAAQARQHLAAVLDAAEAGESVVIERAGVRFRVQAEGKRSRRRRPPVVEWLDPAVESGNWSWVWTKRGLRFSARKPRRR